MTIKVSTLGSTICLCMSMLGILSGCATLSKQECLVGNWQAIGFADGTAGRSADYLNRHNKACARAGVAADYQRWERGRQEGLKQYCTVTNAYQLGRKGIQLNGVCSAKITPRLDRINADGRQYYSYTKQIGIEKARLQQYQEDYRKLREGDNLHFTNERDARRYLSSLPEKAQSVSRRIDNLQRSIKQLQQQYGY